MQTRERAVPVTVNKSLTVAVNKQTKHMARHRLVFCSPNEIAKSFAQGSNENPRLLRGADSRR